MKKITFAIVLALILFAAFNLAPAQVQKQQELKQPEKVASSSQMSDQQSAGKSDENEVKHFDVKIDVNNISSSNMKRIVFYIRPEKIVKTSAWKLYIFRAKIKSWDPKNSDRLAAHIIEGKGIPPTNIVWDGDGSNGNPLPAGKYYYILAAYDDGLVYGSDCLNFKI